MSAWLRSLTQALRLHLLGAVIGRRSRIRPVQRAIPMLSYEDVAAATDWLGKAFGFREEGERFTDDARR